jgi:hypothetical protein
MNAFVPTTRTCLIIKREKSITNEIAVVIAAVNAKVLLCTVLYCLYLPVAHSVYCSTAVLIFHELSRERKRDANKEKAMKNERALALLS